MSKLTPMQEGKAAIVAENKRRIDAGGQAMTPEEKKDFSKARSDAKKADKTPAPKTPFNPNTGALAPKVESTPKEELPMKLIITDPKLEAKTKAVEGLWDGIEKRANDYFAEHPELDGMQKFVMEGHTVNFKVSRAEKTIDLKYHSPATGKEVEKVIPKVTVSKEQSNSTDAGRFTLVCTDKALETKTRNTGAWFEIENGVNEYLKQNPAATGMVLIEINGHKHNFKINQINKTADLKHRSPVK